MRGQHFQAVIFSVAIENNALGYYNNYVDNDVMYIEMEYANGGTLLQLINNQPDSLAEVSVKMFNGLCVMQYAYCKIYIST